MNRKNISGNIKYKFFNRWLIILFLLSQVALSYALWGRNESPVGECVKYESRTRMHPMPTGKTMSIVPITSKYCVERRRIAGQPLDQSK